MGDKRKPNYLMRSNLSVDRLAEFTGQQVEVVDTTSFPYEIRSLNITPLSPPAGRIYSIQFRYSEIE